MDDRLVTKIVGFSDILRDSGVGVIDYTEQITYLLFLKMADEFETRPVNPQKILPDDYSWNRLSNLSGEKLQIQYEETLTALSKEPGTLGVIFKKAQNKITDPANLKRLISDLIDSENWSINGIDLLGTAYEALLAKGAEDIKSGAGQYFTPRPVINAIINVMNPTIKDSIHDPASGTGGFLIQAHKFVAGLTNYNKEETLYLQNNLVSGADIVEYSARVGAMNMLLNGIGTPSGESLIEPKDSLAKDDGKRFSMVLANPPFGKKSSTKIIDKEGKIKTKSSPIVREDFWVSTSNKALNFIQHINTILKINGKAAVIVTDGVLFEEHAGTNIRKRLLYEMNLHTILRLPTGIFYKPGVKTNVLFFEKKPPSETPWTKNLWIYDLRTNMHFTPKEHKIKESDLSDFVNSYNKEDISSRVESERFKKFTLEKLLEDKNLDLDIKWIEDKNKIDYKNLKTPKEYVEIINKNLNEVSVSLEKIIKNLNKTN